MHWLRLKSLAIFPRLDSKNLQTLTNPATIVLLANRDQPHNFNCNTLSKRYYEALIHTTQIQCVFFVINEPLTILLISLTFVMMGVALVMYTERKEHT